MFVGFLFTLGFVCVVLGYCDGTIVFPCTTPSNETGLCVSLFSCPSLIKLLATLERSAVQHVHKSICRNWSLRDLMVCCEKPKDSPLVVKPETETEQVESTSKPAISNDKKAHRDFVIKKLLPTRAYCGLQHTDDRFYNDTETALDEFPWLVHAIWTEEEDLFEFADRCNGALITNRYVLTSHYCARHPIKVRLGQYNTNKTISCISNPDFPECTEPTAVIEIEKEIHRQVEILTLYHDFALFRLAKPVEYNDFIRPICLPLDDSTKPEEQESFVFSGWGAPTQAGVTKKRLTYNSTASEECNWGRNQTDEVEASENLICLTPTKNNTEPACYGEEGGPLMYSFKHQWFARGIITKVYAAFNEECSTTKPVDALKITPEVIEWILDNIDE